jgi:ubiquinone/menaquinone biosynthesis C-methylase UbiE
MMERVNRSTGHAREWYDRLAAVYDKLSGPEKPFIRRGLELLEPVKGERMLEIGFGTGEALISMAEQVDSKGEIVGIDLSPKMKEKAESKIERAGLTKRVRLVRGDAADLPFPDDHFDGIFTSFTIDLLDNPKIPIVLGEMRRVLREKGRLAAVSLNEENGIAVKIYNRVHDMAPKLVDCRPIPLDRILSDAGFEILKVERDRMAGIPVIIVLATASQPRQRT